MRYAIAWNSEKQEPQFLEPPEWAAAKNKHDRRVIVGYLDVTADKERNQIITLRKS